MSFNIDSFVKAASKTPIQKITDLVTTGTRSVSVAVATAKSLMQSGSSLNTITQLAANKTDAIVSGGADEYFAIAGMATSRAVGGSINELRNAGSGSTSDHYKSLPSMKIATSKREDDLTIMSVV